MVSDLLADQRGIGQMAGVGSAVRGGACPDKGNLMLGIEVIEIHRQPPLRKRERGGLSAGGAYGLSALDGFHVGTLWQISMAVPAKPGKVSVISIVALAPMAIDTISTLAGAWRHASNSN